MWRTGIYEQELRPGAERQTYLSAILYPISINKNEEKANLTKHLIGKVWAAGKLRLGDWGVIFYLQQRIYSHVSQALAVRQTPSGFYLFAKLKKFKKGRTFVDDEDVTYTSNDWRENPRSTILQRNTSFAETLDQVHFACSRLHLTTSNLSCVNFTSFRFTNELSINCRWWSTSVCMDWHHHTWLLTVFM